MRKFIVPLLLASTLMPAAASARDDDRGNRVRAERDDGDRASSPKDRPQRAAREQRSNDSEPTVHVERVQRVERPVVVETEVQQNHSAEPVQRVRRIERAERPVRVHREERQVQVVEPVQQVQSTEPVQQVRTQRSRGTLADGFRAAGRDIQENGTAESRRDRDGDGRRWSGEWRRDHRYDWRHHRDRHRSLFRLGRYYDPYGWGYRRFSIGFNLWPSYYGSSYWLNDPWMYRLPPAYGPYRWVRYHDDALLVNIYTGQVVDVLYNFFW